MGKKRRVFKVWK